MEEITEALLHKLYIQDKKSLREIGLLYGRSTKWAYHQLVKFNIPRRAFSTKGIKLTPEWREKVVKTLKQGKGEANGNWKDGRTIKDGYIFLRMPDYPSAHPNGYIEEHRFVIEKEIKRQLRRDEHIHHLDGNKTNNNPKNLIILSRRDHGKIHWWEEEKRKDRSELMKKIRKETNWSTKKVHNK